MSSPTPGREGWKVAELAAATGVLPRTIHFYDEIGLLVPSLVTPAGARRYTEVDARRLRRIVALRDLGHPVKKLPGLLADDLTEPAEAGGEILRR